MKVGIVGAGLGGMLSGILLLKKGYEVSIFEKLPFPGGRFTNLEYKGFKLSTGALHMVPHGEKGPLGKMLKSLGIKIDMVHSDPEGYFRINGEDYLFNELYNLFPFKNKIKIMSLLACLKFGSGGNEAYEEWLGKRADEPLISKISNSFCGWALSLRPDQISSKEFIAITKNMAKLGGPGIPLGGCGGLMKSLVEEFESRGGKLFCKKNIKGIKVENGKATGIKTKILHRFDLIVSDIGPKKTIDLCGKENLRRDYVNFVGRIKEASGIKISISCKKPMLGHTGVLFTPQAKRISGLNEVTNADPSLAPGNKHLMMSYQVLDPSKNVEKEIKLGIKDLHKIFPDFDKYCDILLIQTYKNDWPVNRALSGFHIDPVSPLKGLYYVGDAIKPTGWMETEGVAKGVEIAIEKIG